jgi:Bacterial SH3 domain
LLLGGAAYYHWGRKSASLQSGQVKYVVSPSLDVLDTPAPVHQVIGILKTGDRVHVLSVGGDWAKVQLANGSQGWVLAKELIDSGIYEKGQTLLKGLSNELVQAAGHCAGVVNLHTEPSREAPVLAMLTQGEPLEVFGRRMVQRQSAGSPVGAPASAASALEAWYLIRSGSRAGWLLGRFVSLDIPPAISPYAENYNLVAWFVLDTVRDGGQAVPQYLVADRVGTGLYDFTHIRVFTWWVKRHHYVTAYVESNLKGSFPIQVERLGNVPYFRLRLVDNQGDKFQKVYKLSSTIVRPIGIVEGWESDARPQAARRHTRR